MKQFAPVASHPATYQKTLTSFILFLAVDTSGLGNAKKTLCDCSFLSTSWPSKDVTSIYILLSNAPVSLPLPQSHPTHSFLKGLIISTPFSRKILWAIRDFHDQHFELCNFSITGFKFHDCLSIDNTDVFEFHDFPQLLMISDKLTTLHIKV